MKVVNYRVAGIDPKQGRNYQHAGDYKTKAAAQEARRELKARGHVRTFVKKETLF